MTPAASLVVGTAGHIDHGKSSLVEALTGIDPDRWEEEKRRGITIDLGFAHLDLDDGLRIGLVDVPGHERFVKNMLAGAGGMDAVILVVAADESLMPQTREHFDICRLLGVGTGLVALTKVDLVHPEIADLVELEIRELTVGSFLDGAPVVRTSISTGEGLDELRRQLARLLRAAPGRPSDGPARLPVDRVFSVHGFGTVITGTLVAGSVAVGDALELLPARRPATARGIQVHGSPVETATAGQRVAVNLQGVATDEIGRGDVLVTPGCFAVGHLVDARVHVLEGFGPVEHLQRVRFHHGAAEILARLALLEGPVIAPGDSGLVQLRLESPHAVAPDDRFILRRYSPMVSLAGGRVIDPAPAKHRGRAARVADRLRRLERGDEVERLIVWVREAGPAGLAAELLEQRLAVTPGRLRRIIDAVVSGNDVVAFGDPPHLLSRAGRDALQERIRAILAEHHGAHPLRPGMPKQELRNRAARHLAPAVFDAALDDLARRGVLRGDADLIALAGHAVTLDDDQARLRDGLLALYEDAGLAAPTLEEAARRLDAGLTDVSDIVHHLLRAGELARVRDDLFVRAGVLEAMVDELRRRHGRGDTFGVAGFKEWTGVSRKHAIPLLEYLDQRRVTRRVGDLRVRL